MADVVNPFELLKDEMEHDDISIRINAMHRLKTVVTLTGGENFKNQLLPYIEALIKKEDDEVLYAIAEELGNIANMLHGGYSLLLPLLETLSSVEETVIRDAAVKSLQTISNLMSDSEIQTTFIPMVLRLAGGDWFTSRVSAVNLMNSIYQRAGSFKDKIRQKFLDLCNEETPMVRRAIASRIGNLASCVEKDTVLTEFIPIFKQLSSDEQDSVRVLCLDSLKLIAKILSKDENRTHALPIIIGATEDKSWRIRLALAKNFSQLGEAFGKEITEISLIQIFTTLLKDPENEVKNAAVTSLSSFIKIITVEKINLLIPQIQTLARDNFSNVRTGICEVLTNMVSLVGKEVSLQKLFPYLLELVEDKDPEVKISAMRTFPKFAEVVGTDIMNPLMSHVKNLMEDKKWRVRIAAYETITTIALQFKNVELFVKSIEPVYLNYLKDRAQTIREFGVNGLPALVQTFPNEWFFANLLPKLNDALSKENSYLLRITALYSLKSASQNLSADIISSKILPTILKHAKDPVPNIRFVVIKILKAYLPLNNAAIINQIKGVLEELVNDTDKDVQYYAYETLQSL